MLKYITVTTHVLSRSKTDEFLMHMIEHFVNIAYNHQIDVLWCECLGDNGRCFDFPQFWVCHSNLRDEYSCGPILSDSHFTTVNTVSPRFEWTLRFHPELRQWHESPRIEEIAFESPRFDPITYFSGWPSTWLLSYSHYLIRTTCVHYRMSSEWLTILSHPDDKTSFEPLSHPDELAPGRISSGWLMCDALCHLDDLAGVGSSSGWVTANSLCNPDDTPFHLMSSGWLNWG